MPLSAMTSASLALGWMFSPDGLVLLGNIAGQSGSLFWVPMIFGTVVTLLGVFLLHHPVLANKDDSPFTRQVATIGTFGTMSVNLASRLSLVLLLPTGMLVTAGFTFNETFVYWFPNFGFSFLLLAVILMLHLAGNHLALKAQPFFFVLTISSLALLTFAGLILAPASQAIEIQPGHWRSLSPSLILLPVILFLGCDRVYPTHSSGERTSSLIAVITGITILTLWGIVSLKHVPQAKLAGSTIPYIITAKEILGQPGRIIIGIAIISGTCALVNGLFLMARQSLQELTAHFLLAPGSRVKRITQDGKIWPLFFTLFIALFIGSGLAGKEELTSFIYGALLLWLLSVGTHCFTAARTLHILRGSPSFCGYLVSAFFPLTAVWLAWFNEHAATLAVFCCLVLVSSCIFSFGCIWLSKKEGSKTFHPSSGDIS